MGFLSSPNTAYTDFYDQARFKLVWNISLVFTVFIVVLTVLNYTSESYNPLSYLLASMISITSVIILKVYRTYEFVSKLISIGGLSIVTYTFLGLSNVIQYTTPMWMVIDIIFTYFTSGRRWGGVILGLNLVVVTVFFYTKFTGNLLNLPDYNSHDILLFVIEYVIVGALMGYFLHMFVTTNYYAERNVKVSNEQLNTHNELITKQNQEKEVMLKEIHHRVKNNLQVITSLLRLQSYEIEDDRSRKHFKEAIDRVKAMALIHEKMYQKDMLENFDLESYINSLANELLDTYAIDKPVKFKIESSVSNIGSRTIVPLALLFNELISNSLKHAFDDAEEPLITIVLVDIDGQEFKMIFGDNGHWKEGSSGSFGQELINSMTEQLDGSFELDKGVSGSTYTFLLRNLRERFDENK